MLAAELIAFIFMCVQLELNKSIKMEELELTHNKALKTRGLFEKIPNRAFILTCPLIVDFVIATLRTQQVVNVLIVRRHTDHDAQDPSLDCTLERGIVDLHH